ncbi:Flagellar biosynthesis protein, FliO [Myxococcus fulvus]|uniref:Flagellar biosynthesis protein, FliO n=1 Tax=Myxococcus fulvus TaxID=33 RepID=A0ABY1C071_MYXFU|nr:flagellar biosynthetic protein FliO [Myxococcus fulvus]SET45081.1 Flagellar biosynthesis protein, FliO [Myxococcus fulvus]
MNARRFSFSPRARVQVATLLVLALALLGPMGGMSMVSVARGVLLVGALGGLGWWWWRRGARGTSAASLERLKVVSRAGLSPRCGLALVEVEGRDFLVTFGDAFAHVHALPERRQAAPFVLAPARRPRPGRGMRRGMRS